MGQLDTWYVETSGVNSGDAVNLGTGAVHEFTPPGAGFGTMGFGTGPFGGGES